jgi:hypothetical protein
MTFEIYVPYSVDELESMQNLGLEIEHAYLSVEELIDAHGLIDYSVTDMENISVKLLNKEADYWLTFNDISLN